MDADGPPHSPPGQDRSGLRQWPHDPAKARCRPRPWRGWHQSTAADRRVIFPGACSAPSCMPHQASAQSRGNCLAASRTEAGHPDSVHSPTHSRATKSMAVRQVLPVTRRQSVLTAIVAQWLRVINNPVIHRIAPHNGLGPGELYRGRGDPDDRKRPTFQSWHSAGTPQRAVAEASRRRRNGASAQGFELVRHRQ
jgi:hypothetical protein